MDHPVFREVKQLIRLGFPIVVGNSGYTLLAISDIIMSGTYTGPFLSLTN